MRVACWLGLVLAVVLVVSSAYAAASERDQQAEKTEWTLIDMQVIDMLLHYHLVSHGNLPDSGGEFVELDSLRPLRRSEYRKRLPKEDSWGNPFHYWSDGSTYLLHSSGADGVAALDLKAVDPGTLSDRLTAQAGADDILTSEDGPLVHPVTPRGSLKQAMTDIRSIGTAIESYSIDHNVYPGPSPGLVEVGFFSPELEPTYIRTLPRVDPWGQPFLVWSDATQYMILSLGADGRMDADYTMTGDAQESVQGALGATKESWQDIVFANGQFVQWPEGVVQ